MEAGYCVALSAAEAMVLQLRTRQSRVVTAQSFLVFFILQYLAVKVWNLLVYPAFLSPLRNVPGPKVRSLLHSIYIPLLITHTTRTTTL